MQPAIWISSAVLTLLTTLVVSQPIGASSGEERLIVPKDLTYLGTFRFPARTSDEASRWSYGGTGFTYFPKGDPDGSSDSCPGSLYGIGHAHHQLVSEITIPEPVISPTKDARELNVAQTLQSFADITEGVLESTELDRVGGLAYLEKQGAQATDKIYWTAHRDYNVSGTNYDSHGMSELSLANPERKGPWHIGPRNNEFHSMKTADYIFDVPRAWADQHLGGKYLVSGRQRGTGAFGSSAGPALFAFAPYQHPDGNPPEGAEIDATALMWYPLDGGYFPDHKACDRWRGGAWLTDGDKSSVIIVGRKSLGEAYYGEGRENDCSKSKGWHCGPYTAQILFFDPNELAKVVRGDKEPWQMLPYTRMDLKEFLWPTCGWQLGGAAFDRERGKLYIIQYGAERVTSQYEAYPLVHVFRVGAASQDMTPPAPPTGLTID